MRFKFILISVFTLFIYSCGENTDQSTVSDINNSSSAENNAAEENNETLPEILAYNSLDQDSQKYPYLLNPNDIELTNHEKVILSETNRIRLDYKATMIVVSSGLIKSARSQVGAMQHYPYVKGALGRLHHLVSRPFGARENLGAYGTPQEAINGWLGSPGHFANMTNKSWRCAGATMTGIYSAQHFSGHCETDYNSAEVQNAIEKTNETVRIVKEYNKVVVKKKSVARNSVNNGNVKYYNKNTTTYRNKTRRTYRR